MQAPLLEATLYSQYIEPIIQRVTLYAPDILIALVLLIVGVPRDQVGHQIG